MVSQSFGELTCRQPTPFCGGDKGGGEARGGGQREKERKRERSGEEGEGRRESQFWHNVCEKIRARDREMGSENNTFCAVGVAALVWCSLCRSVWREDGGAGSQMSLILRPVVLLCCAITLGLHSAFFFVVVLYLLFALALFSPQSARKEKHRERGEEVGTPGR